MEPRLKIETARVDELAPYAGNAKEHPEWQVGQIAASIEQFGMCDPVAIWHDRNGTPVIVEGHGRVLALKKLGRETVPVIALDHLDDDARRAYVHIHNATTLSSGFDLDILDAEIASLPDFEWGDFGLDVAAVPDNWFETRERNDTSREDGNEEYNEFLEKFEAKKTTDDCYTPDVVYEAVAEWVAGEYGLDRSAFVRPFYPGGDFEAFKYEPGAVVVDNPPFSIMSEILRFYTARGIRFFLFASTLTLFSGRGLDVCYVPTGVAVTYENGANVNTSFVTNLERHRIRTAPALHDAIKAANETNQRAMHKELPKYEYPPHVVTSAGVSRYSVHGVDFVVEPEDCHRISDLDAMKESGKAIYGGGFLLSDKAAEDNARAMRERDENVRRKEIERLEQAVENPGATVSESGTVFWKLSEREEEIVRSLG